ncbi:MAG: dienelactone hydrolase family protein [Chloroflexota bacterium]
MPPMTETVSFPGTSVPQLGGYLARPEGNGPFPAIVVIHEAYGLNNNIRSVAERFAGEGYIALAVDLFAGRNVMVCMARFIAGAIFNSLENNGIKDLKRSLDFLATQPGVDPARLGAIGFCLGGSFAISWACTDNRLKAVAPYYAFNPRPLEAVARMCPVVGSYPEQDITANMGKKLDITLDGYSIPHDIKSYPSAHHSFFNDQGGSYDAAAAGDSWQRVLAFFKEKGLSL